jgi:hypothetical protein
VVALAIDALLPALDITIGTTEVDNQLLQWFFLALGLAL